MNGDVLTNLDYDRLVDFTPRVRRGADHRDDGQAGADRPRGDRHGDGYVNGYVEKPTLDYHVSMGIYVYDQRALRTSPRARASSPNSSCACSTPGAVAAYLSDADWFDIGTVEEYERALPRSRPRSGSA